MTMENFVLENQWWKLGIQNSSDKGFICELYGKVNDVTYADQDYHYSIVTSRKRGSRYQWVDHLVPEYKAKNLSIRNIHMDAEDTLIVNGKFGNTDIWIKHEYKLKKDDKWLDEFITLINKGSKKVGLGLINFGFKKTLFRQHQGWADNLDEYKLTPIPTRRFHGYDGDRKKEAFSANDILYNPWLSKESEMPGFCAEGWLWGNSNGGLLTCKYNPFQFEFSRFRRFSTVLPGRGCEDVAIIFGGVSLCQGNPELATTLDPGQTYAFGVSRYAVYEGDYKNGYYLYRNHLDENGHKFQKGYDPPINWNELYNLGWAAEKTGFFTDCSEFEVYKLEDLYNEAAIARDIGAECLYLDPGWNTFMGSEIWNAERFGSLKEFSKTIHEKYGLKLGLHLMMNFASENEPDEFYLRTKKGVRLVADPYINLYSLCANEKWVQEKSRRILELAKEGVDFLMFDFTGFSNFMADNVGCCSPDHGHEVPMRRQTHAQNIFRVIQNVKKHYPNILIEAHDRGVNHQLYYQHNLPHSFDENWGFECMWNSMQDLMSLKAIKLYEYNLTCSIPLYLHVNENSDNDSMLQFWWYASVARHVGIGGLKDRNSAKYKALKNALNLYKRVKPIMTRGVFYGIEPMIHLHVADDSGTGVLVACNITSRDKKCKIKIDTQICGVQFRSVEIFTGTNQKREPISKLYEANKFFEFEVEIPSLSPIIAILK